MFSAMIFPPHARLGRCFEGPLLRADEIFLGCASVKGHGLIDRRLYLPKEWAIDVERK
jgi:hypothetical protein